MRVFKSNQKQNLVVFMEPSENTAFIGLKCGNMILNRFCIDEDAAFELSGVNFFKSGEIPRFFNSKEKGTESILF